MLTLEIGIKQQDCFRPRLVRKTPDLIDHKTKQFQGHKSGGTRVAPRSALFLFT